jgi:transcriptional regulator with XRE-family HTH domain
MSQSTLLKKLGATIRQLRRENDFTQNYVSQKANLNISYYRDIESGKVRPSREKLWSVTEVLPGDQSEIVASYIQTFVTQDECFGFVQDCLEKGLTSYAKKGINKLFELVRPSKIRSQDLDFFILFIDK